MYTTHFEAITTTNQSNMWIGKAAHQSNDTKTHVKNQTSQAYNEIVATSVVVNCFDI